MNQNHEHPRDDRDDIARLVRLAGKRIAVPRDRAARVREAARKQWQGELDRRSRRRWIWAAAGLATAASLVLALALLVSPFGVGLRTTSDSTALVEVLAGPAWTRPSVGAQDVQPRPVQVGDSLPLGAELWTAERGQAAIRFDSGHSVRIDELTRIHLLEGPDLGLDQGAIYVDSGRDPQAGSLSVQTPFGTIEETGTQFEVRLEPDSIRVGLREGAVIVRHEKESYGIVAGSEWEMDSSGSVTRRAIPTHGPRWNWFVGVTPMLDLEGKSARTFLNWVARERGWSLAFADEDVLRAAEKTVLSGTVERLTLDEALDAVLPTCRMTHRVEQGVLRVSAMPEE